MVGCFFAYNFWKDQQMAKVEAEKAKAEAPFFLAAKEALDESHKLESAIGIGVTYQKYNEQLIVFATKVDNLNRAARDTGFSHNQNAEKLCHELREARDDYHSAMGWWDAKNEHPDYADKYPSLYAEVENKLQSDWSDAAKDICEADRLFRKLKE
jgi:hypothetical protein